MMDLLRELFHYQAWADSQLMAAIKAHPPAAGDPEILKLLHHIIGVQRFFMSQIEGREFDLQREGQVPSTIEGMEQLLAETQAIELALADRIGELDLGGVLDRPPLDKMKPSIGTALAQVVLHSQHHRGQVATRLRVLGGAPPTVDYILWKMNRG